MILKYSLLLELEITHDEAYQILKTIKQEDEDEFSSSNTPGMQRGYWEL
jgi:hypothetical protein